MDTLFPHLHFAGRGIQGHVTSLVRMKIQHYVWTKEETEYFWTKNHKKQKMILLDSKQT